MVTWGGTSTKTYTPSTPASTAPSPAGFSASSLGNAPATATSTSFTSANPFAGSKPGPSTNTFGGFSSFAPSPATATSTSGFGATAASPVGFGGFGTPQPNAGNPANATTFLSGGSPYHHAHVAAHQREEQGRIETQLLSLANGYSPTAPSAAPAPSALFGATPNQPAHQLNSLCRFQCLLYDPIDMTPGTTGNERPIHISVSDWAQAQAYNPDPAKLKPVSIVGAEALQQRVVAQQEKANNLERSIDVLKSALDTLESKIEEGKVAIEHLTMVQVKLEQRMLNFMYKLHLMKCALMGRQGVRIMREERDWINKMYLVKNNLSKLEHFCSTNLHQQVEQVLSERNRGPSNVARKTDADNSAFGTLNLQEQEEFQAVLEKTQTGLQELKKIVTRDARDIQILMKEMSIKQAGH